MVENNSAMACTCPLYRRRALGLGNVTHKRLNTLVNDTFDERSKAVT